MAHQWRFYRSGGFDQVKLDTIDDWQHLHELDPKLWAALSCPVKGLEFDERTMQYLDTDHDGRVRIDEVLAAIKWSLSVLREPDVLLAGDALNLAAIDVLNADGERLVASAKRMLRSLGKANATSISCADTADMAKIFPADQLNGDGIVCLPLCNNDAQRDLVSDILSCGFSAIDRCGEAGVDLAGLNAFLEQAKAFVAWKNAEAQIHQPFGENVAQVHQLFAALNDKVQDYFTRCALAAYDETSVAGLNASADDYATLSRRLLNAETLAVEHFPIAKVSANASLNVDQGVHPHWADKLLKLRSLVAPLIGEGHSLTKTQWQQIADTLLPYHEWLQNKPNTSVAVIDAERLARDLADENVQSLCQLMADDLAEKPEAESVLDVDKLVRFQAHLRHLLRNFVNLENFYALDGGAIFQNGRLFIDGRSCDLCMEVHDAAKHAKMAGLSGTYLLYMDCVRFATGDKKSVVAAVTAGDSGNLMVGRNGVFYDREGTDWDATVNRIIENPISVREAFFTPYRRIVRMISEQVQKFAAAKDKDIETKSAANVDGASKAVEVGAKPAAPAPFDVAKFAGIFAAIGLAIGAIGTALAAVITGFLGLQWWQMPIALFAIVALISGPSMIIAWFKLKKRNLAPLLDANGWAVNTNAKISIKFGTRLTALARIPEGSRRSLKDPFEPKSNVGSIAFLALIMIACWWLWREGYFAHWFNF